MIRHGVIVICNSNSKLHTSVCNSNSNIFIQIKSNSNSMSIPVIVYRYEVPPVILVLIPLTHLSTWSNSPWMTDLIN